MAEPDEESRETYVYRRVAPDQWNRQGDVSAELFLLGKAIKGLSVYHADKVTPREALQALIEEKRILLASINEVYRIQAQGWILKNPDVETLVQKRWRIVKLPVSEIKAMGFELEEPDENGHLNILGESSRFDKYQDEFTELIKIGKATLLSAEECLQEK